MSDMKFDMSGGAAVMEATARSPGWSAAARRHRDRRDGEPAVGRAMKPGDIVRATTGTTIEVINTDAEGRLVLADCLAGDRAGRRAPGRPRTLTGAIVIALGTTYAGPVGHRRRLGRGVRPPRARAGELVGAAAPRRLRRAIEGRSPTSPTRSRPARPARSPPPSSSRASSPTCRGRTSTSRAPRDTGRPTRTRAAPASGCGSCWSSPRLPRSSRR